MASDVKWIKMIVGMFDGGSFKRIKRAKIGGESFRDKLTAVWFELMDFAGKCNHGGAFVEANEIAFKDLSDIAIMLDRETEELELCMSFFIREGMVEIVDDVYCLTNWSIYQNKEGLDKIREQTRMRVAKHRENQKLLACNVTSNVTVTQCNATEEDKEEDKRVFSKENTRKKPAKNKFGEFGNVRLTDDEYSDLAGTYGEDLRDKAIAFLDEYVEEKGYKSKSHNLAIRRWVIDAVSKNAPKAPAKKESMTKEEEYALKKLLGENWNGG